MPEVRVQDACRAGYLVTIYCDVFFGFCCSRRVNLEAFASFLLRESIASRATDDLFYILTNVGNAEIVCALFNGGEYRHAL